LYNTKHKLIRNFMTNSKLIITKKLEEKSRFFYEISYIGSVLIGLVYGSFVPHVSN
jgi:hypothetical protein